MQRLNTMVIFQNENVVEYGYTSRRLPTNTVMMLHCQKLNLNYFNCCITRVAARC
jgi:hypothetical protein